MLTTVPLAGWVTPLTVRGSSSGSVSFLKGEFTHGNGESMFVVRDKNSQNFYFFINNSYNFV